MTNNELKSDEYKSIDKVDVTRDKLIHFVKEKRTLISYLLLVLILWFGAKIRLSNISTLKDVTTGKYVPLALDPHLFLRYARYIIDHGNLFTIDNFRYVPFGLETIRMSPITAYAIVFVQKILGIFSGNLSIEKAAVLYPVIFFIFGGIVFYLLVRELFDNKIALLSTAFLVVIPAYLYRTMAGFGDKEPLGIFFMYAAMYFFILSWHTKKLKFSILFGILAGVFTGLMNLTWGGGQFILFLIAGFSLIELFLNKFTKEDLYAFTSWFIFYVIIVTVFSASELFGLFWDITTQISLLVILVGVTTFIISSKFPAFKEKISKKVPIGLFSLFIAAIFGVAFLTILFGPSFIQSQISSVIDKLIHPIGTGRLTLTVAESHQPYFSDWRGNFGLFYFLLFFSGSIVMFFDALKPLAKHRIKLTVVFGLFLSAFIFSRYSANSPVFNGESTFSNVVYIGSLIAFILIMAIFYLYRHYKSKGEIEELSRVNKKYIFTLVWFFLMIVATRGAIRFFLILTPISVILASYLISSVANLGFKFKERIIRLGVVVIIIFLIFSPFNFYEGVFTGFAKASMQQAKFTGPSYNQQWQLAMEWVRENTLEDAVFAHWWDYGYWVQTGGNRATVLDGGNFISYWDYLMGRYVLTNPEEEEALSFLKTHNATHFLIDPTDIGKYPAYSSIGSDNNFDRYSWINTFTVNPQHIQETRNETVYVYSGGTSLDADFIYEEKVYPRLGAGIGGFLVPVIQEDDSFIINQPNAILVYQGQQTMIPVECIYIETDDGLTSYKYSKEGLKGCLRLINLFENNGRVVNRNLAIPAAALYLSEKAVNALWAQLYLLDKDTENFELVYTDQNRVPLAVLDGRLIGPLKIWRINYPSYIKTEDRFLETTAPSGLVGW